MEVLKQVIRLMKRIEGAFCPWSYLDQMDYFQQGGCNEEEAYAYANSNIYDKVQIAAAVKLCRFIQ